MPFVDLPNAHDDYASLWYITNSATGTVGGFDPSKATVLLLHPQFLDSAWLSAQFEDPRLSSKYNLIALDARHAGQTTSRLNGKQDSWTDAADLAFALEVRALFTIFFACTHNCPPIEGRLVGCLILRGLLGTLSSRCSCLGV